MKVETDIHRGYTESIINKELEGQMIDVEVLCDTSEELIEIITTNDEKVTCKRCLKIMEALKEG